MNPITQLSYYLNMHGEYLRAQLRQRDETIYFGTYAVRRGLHEIGCRAVYLNKNGLFEQQFDEFDHEASGHFRTNPARAMYAFVNYGDNDPDDVINFVEVELQKLGITPPPRSAAYHAAPEPPFYPSQTYGQSPE